MTKQIININGEIFDSKEAKVSVFDRGFLYGDSVYEVTSTHKGKLILLEDHFDRLWKSAQKIGLEIQFRRDELENEIYKTLEKLGMNKAYIRLIITRGEGDIGLDPGLSARNNLIIITKELQENPSWWYEKGVHMIIADVLRNPVDSMDPNIKSGNYLNNVLAMSEAKKKDAFDAIMLNHSGYVTEGTTSNIWIIKQEENKTKIITPPLKAGILEGITRKTLMKLALEHPEIEIFEEEFTPDELKSASECFLSSATKDLVPITQVDNQSIGNGQPGPMTLKLLKIYRDYVYPTS